MVSGETGFNPGDGIAEDIEDRGCTAAFVRRRRDSGQQCACRRRHSGQREDGWWRCQNDKMVQEDDPWTNPFWSDEFNHDSSINSSKWNHFVGPNHNNKEQQYYTDNRLNNTRVEDGVLKLIGKHEQYEGMPWTSGRINTKGHADFGPGTRVEVRAKLPLGRGTWPAIWLLPTDKSYGGWPDSGEIDIMEAAGSKPGKVYGTIHTRAYFWELGNQKGKNFRTDIDGWHTYALVWKEDRLEWYTDGNKYFTYVPNDINDYRKWPFNRRMYLILNLAMGGNFGGHISDHEDQVMEVDYVRLFCLDGSTNCTTPKIECCDKCPGQRFCSPRSKSCYDDKRRDYYNECEVGSVPTPPGTPNTPSSAPTEPACCSNCRGNNFCSSVSGSCYDSKSKDYYESCQVVGPTKPACCNNCGGKNFCSSVSGSCYDWKAKDYYESC